MANEKEHGPKHWERASGRPDRKCNWCKLEARANRVIPTLNQIAKKELALSK